MRIAIVSEDYPPDTASGGIGTQAAHKARGLAERGHSVWVLSASRSGSRSEGREGAVRVLRLPPPAGPLEARSEPLRWLAWSLEVARALEALHGAHGFDLVEFPEWGAQAYAWLLARDATRPPKVAVQLHGPLPLLASRIGWPEPGSLLEEVGRSLEGTCLRLADAVYSSSGCSADWAARAYGLDRAAIPTLHTGVDVVRFAPPARPVPDPVVVFVGRIARNKGVEELLEACLALAPRFPGLRLRLVGRGEGAVIAGLRERIREARGSLALELPGFVLHERLPGELRAAQVFAAPSRFEGGPGFVYLEAMATGLPVVGTRGNGSGEVLEAGRNALLVPPGDVDALARALERLLGDPGLRTRLGEAARRHVLRTASSRHALDRLERYLAGIVAGRQPEPAAGPARTAAEARP